jgi:hypothetical protein
MVERQISSHLRINRINVAMRRIGRAHLASRVQATRLSDGIKCCQLPVIGPVVRRQHGGAVGTTTCCGRMLEPGLHTCEILHLNMINDEKTTE